MSDEISRPVFARFFAWASPAMDEGGMAELRTRMLAGLSGRVIEIGAGNGLNFARYPAEVTEVHAVEPEPRLRRIAERAAAGAPVPVRVTAGTADRLPADDGTYDAAVFSLVLCSVPDQSRALGEAYRVLRPGGELRFLEHVRAQGRVLGTVQRVLDATVWPLLLGGCHTHRDTAAAIAAAGFTVTRLDRLRFPPGGPTMPSSPHIVGAATRPGTPYPPER